MADMKPPTRVNHPPDVEVPEGNRPVVAPIYQSVKFEFESVAQTLEHFGGKRPGFYYQRDSNPTNRQLELTLAAMQGRADAIVCASGVAAIAGALLSLTKQGDHVLCFVESYGPTRQLIRRTLGKYGVTPTLLSVLDLAGIERELKTHATRLLIFESPSNPINRIADLAAITALARAHGALTLLDNTCAGLHQHGEFDLDIFLHSLTKFAGGHSDVMGGAVIANKELIGKLRPDFKVFGSVMDPHAAFLIQRGLKTYFLRYRAQSAQALEMARFLSSQPGVSAVHYPGLQSDPGHALARAQMSEFGCVVTFELAGGAPAAERLADALKLFARAASLGATESLVLPSQFMSTRDLDPGQVQISGIRPGTVRLSIGLEDLEDLKADVQEALHAAAG
jgi:cystathionine beta-lyase/cystathionine gamma-synthase